MKNIILVLVVLLLPGCATVYKQAGVSSLPSSEVAVVDVAPCEIGDSCIFFQEIDGKWRGVGSITHYELLPGTRVLKVVFVAPGLRGNGGILVKFNARPGGHYFVRGNVDEARRSWSPEIIDAQTGKVVSEKVAVKAVY